MSSVYPVLSIYNGFNKLIRIINSFNEINESLQMYIKNIVKLTR